MIEDETPGSLHGWTDQHNDTEAKREVYESYKNDVQVIRPGVLQDVTDIRKLKEPKTPA
ncbi:MAG: hypothetical protein ACOC14_01835 [Bacillota bacterium]